MAKLSLKLLATSITFLASVVYVASASATLSDECVDWQKLHPDWLWCDDFESSSSLESRYYDYDLDSGDLRTSDKHSVGGTKSLTARWSKGEIDAGHLLTLFGKNPLKDVGSEENVKEVYWRFYMKLEEQFQGFPDKVSRATIFATSNWRQAMIAHLWFNESKPGTLLLDPSSGINRATNELRTKSYNDFSNLKWLGIGPGSTVLKPGQWYCIEAHVKLNSQGKPDGLFEFWLDSKLEAKREQLNWLGTWSEYGINAIMLSNYWNQGSPKDQSRFIDSFVISKSRIGCR